MLRKINSSSFYFVSRVCLSRQLTPLTRTCFTHLHHFTSTFPVISSPTLIQTASFSSYRRTKSQDTIENHLNSQSHKMEVTKRNFDQVVNEFEALLPTCSFVAIDEEMTGISLFNPATGQVENGTKVSDSIQERYAKMKPVAETYRIIQLGVCLFHPKQAQSEQGDNSQQVSYEARPYNFYLFPEQGNVFMEATAVHFNKDHNMDFNRWIYHGIPYVHAEEEKKLHEKFFPEPVTTTTSTNTSTTPSTPSSRTITLTKEDDINFVNRSLTILTDFVNSRLNTTIDEKSASSSSSSSTNSTNEDATMDDQPSTDSPLSSAPTITLPECNSFLRLAIRQRVEDDPLLKDNIILEAKPQEKNKARLDFIAYYLPLTQRDALSKAREKEKLNKFNMKLGFRRVFNLLTAAKKPIIGHNCLYDLLFLYTHLVHPILPSSLKDFKQKFTALFPLVFDTKFLSLSKPFSQKTIVVENKPIEQSTSSTSAQTNSNDMLASSTPVNQVEYSTKVVSRFRETHLGSLYDAISAEQKESLSNATSPPTISSELLPVRKQAVIQFADGFDRYSSANGQAHEAGFDAYMTGCIFAQFAAEGDLLASNPLADSTRNRLTLFRHPCAVNLSGDDGFLDGDEVAPYELRGFPQEWQTSDVQQALTEISSTSYRIQWVDGMSLLVMVPINDIPQVEAKISELFPNQRASSSSSSSSSSQVADTSSSSTESTPAAAVGLRKCSYFGKFDFFRSSDESDTSMEENENQPKKRKTDNAV